MANVHHPQEPFPSKALLQRGDASRGSSTETARAILLQRGDASRGSSAESARAALLQRGDASRASSAESARATLLHRGDASRGSSTESARAALLQRGDASRGSRLSLPERPCCRGLMQTDLLQIWALISNNPSQNVSDTSEGWTWMRRLFNVDFSARGWPQRIFEAPRQGTTQH